MFLVEDELMIGLLLEDILSEAGCFVVGPYSAFNTAMEAARNGDFGAAVLDVNLGGKLSYPIGEILEQRGIQFVLISGYGESAAPPQHPAWPVCKKPFTPQTLLAAISALRVEGDSIKLDPVKTRLRMTPK